jgi:hypothetical protein
MTGGGFTVDSKLVVALSIVLVRAVAAPAQVAPLDLGAIAQAGNVDPQLVVRLNQHSKCGFDRSPLRAALSELSIANSLPIKLSPSVEQELTDATRVTARFVGTPVSTVLRLIVRQTG